MLGFFPLMLAVATRTGALHLYRRRKKAGKYSHISSTYHFHLIAMETSGAIGLKCGSSV